MAYLNQVPRGVALCSLNGSLLHANELFFSFDIPSPSDLIQQSIGLDFESFDYQIQNKAIRIDIVKLDDGYAIVAEDIQKRLISSDQIIANLVASNMDQLFETAVRSISEISGWRWVAISRFKDDQTAEILSIFDQHQKVGNYLYDLMGTPCEVVARTQQFAFFPKLSERFPHYDVMHEMGAKVYAGMVYRSDSVPVGHIFAMHDEEHVNATIIEDVLRLSVSIMGFK